MSDTRVRWGYAINQWKPQFDDFVRREDHERALKTLSVAGFDGVELTSGTGRWEPLGNPQQLIANFGSLGAFRDFLTGCGVTAVSSWYFDPLQRSMEHLTSPLSPLSADDVPGLVARAEEYAAALSELGGSVLVVRAAPPAGDLDRLDDAAVSTLAASWTAVGRATSRHGVRTAVHVDFLSALRRPGTLDAVLDRADDDAVGLAVDTGEQAAAGVDPAALVRRYGERVWHVQYRDALATDEAEEYLQPHAEYAVRARGGARGVPRWFAEPGAVGGLVDFPAVTRALLDVRYAGWIVVESDPSPHPATSALLAGYLVQRSLRPAMASESAESHAPG